MDTAKLLSKRHYPSACGNLRARQSGVVLLITLIVLVAMTLTAIAMVRSMDTTNIIAGNLSFQQAATHSGDTGIETAIRWLELNAANLQNDNFGNGYSSNFANPTPGQSWDQYFRTAELAGRTLPIPMNLVNNTVTYMIERLCVTANTLPNAVGAGCTVTPAFSISVSSSEDGGSVKLNASTQQYYRITSRTVGPHNAKSYVQAIIAL